MLALSVLALALCGLRVAESKAVFAHFMMANALNYSDDDWRIDMSLAQEAHIQAFALNMAYDNPANQPGVAAAFRVANSIGFQLFFSFDYAGNGPWPKQDVVDLLNQYGTNSAHFQYNEQPFVSTFEGPDESDDWTSIKAETNCFFVPSWTSKGAKAALELSNGVADGLFSWAAWPWGPQPMKTDVDATCQRYLADKPYMMPVSPWFFTNLPAFNKNWLWRGDDMWYDRWNQINRLQPEFVEIISWNDYGESHYVGPLNDKSSALFEAGNAPYNYAQAMPHDGWRETLPFTIDRYLHNETIVSQEAVQVWHRPNPNTVCNTGGTTGNTASQAQMEFPPGEMMQNKIYLSVLAVSSPTVSVTIGGADVGGYWTDQPDGGVGIYHGSTDDYGELRGAVVVSVSTGANSMILSNDVGITNACTNGIMNWNAWVGSARGSKGVHGVSQYHENVV